MGEMVEREKGKEGNGRMGRKKGGRSVKVRGGEGGWREDGAA